MNVWSAAPWSLQLCHAYTVENPQDPMKEWMQNWEIMPAHDLVCRACGCGDNTVGHWARWCVVPLIVAIAILKPDTEMLTISQLACQSPRHAVICTLILSCFRRLLRQEGAFLHQQAAEAKSVLWWISKLHESLARDAHVQLQIEFPVSCGAPWRCSLCATQVDIQRILPLDYSTMHLPPMVGICTADVPKGNQLAVLPLNSPVVAALKEMEVSAPSMQCNVEVSLVSCTCSAFHVSLCTTADLCRSDILAPANSCPPRILVLFDGSAHRSRKIGGAGAALLQVECTGVSLLDWGARALPNCADNIVAETHGADLAISLYDKYRILCQQQNIPFKVTSNLFSSTLIFGDGFGAMT